ncbi:MAG: hypothetical protein Q8942_00545 [Bacillota bacterium]|nr:hypothetical protein [Bacillota bacterium]
MNSRIRRPLQRISIFGITYMHRRNPFIIAWWSAIFPGFGHYLLNNYIRATLLTLFEVCINSLGHINESIAYSFCGKFEMAKSVLHPNWASGYLIIYFFTIWDSYRSTVAQNKLCFLAEMENAPLQSFIIDPLEIQYLEQKNPNIAAWYSLLFPGLGQFYNHRFGLAFYTMFWWWLYSILSHVYQSVFYFALGDLQRSISILNIHWLLFMPSVICGATYHAYTTAINHNRLYRLEQRQYLAERYQKSDVLIFL